MVNKGLAWCRRLSWIIAVVVVAGIVAGIIGIAADVAIPQ